MISVLEHDMLSSVRNGFMEASWLGVGCGSYGPAVGRRSLPTLTNPFDWQPTLADVYLRFHIHMQL